MVFWLLQFIIVNIMDFFVILTFYFCCFFRVNSKVVLLREMAWEKFHLFPNFAPEYNHERVETYGLGEG